MTHRTTSSASNPCPPSPLQILGLARRKRRRVNTVDPDVTVTVRTTDKEMEASITFNNADQNGWTPIKTNLTTLIGEFLDKGNKADRATDQLLNTIYSRGLSG
ncbi:MAG: hypothetical protein WCA35_05995 [Kovacikia sp.]